MSGSVDDVEPDGCNWLGGWPEVQELRRFNIMRSSHDKNEVNFVQPNGDPIMTMWISIASPARRALDLLVGSCPRNLRSRDLDLRLAEPNDAIIEKGVHLSRAAFRVTVWDADGKVLGTAIGKHRQFTVTVVDEAEQVVALGDWTNALVLRDPEGKDVLSAELASFPGPPQRRGKGLWARYGGAEVQLGDDISLKTRALATGVAVGWCLAHRWHLGDRPMERADDYFGWKGH